MSSWGLSSFSIKDCLEKMGDPDKDLRHMALYDLQDALHKGFQVDERHGKPLVDKLLRLLLQDGSSDVQGMAVKSLGPLSPILRKEEVHQLVSELLHRLSGTEKEERGIAVIALKALLENMDTRQHEAAILVVAKEVTGLIARDDDSIASDAIEVTTELVTRAGGVISSSHQSLLSNLLSQLSCHRAGVRKRVTRALAILSSSLIDDLFLQLVKKLIDGLRERAYIQALGSISREAGFRLGPFLGEIGPALLNVSFDEDAAEDDLKEMILSTFSSLALKCTRHVTPELGKQMINSAVESISYDPNYDDMMVDDDEDNVFDDSMDESSESSDDDEDFSDDDDTSWKVRRAAARLMDALIESSSTERLHYIAQTLCSSKSAVLVERVRREREPSVKKEVLAAFVSLLRRVRSSANVTILNLIAEMEKPVIDSLMSQRKDKAKDILVDIFVTLREFQLTMLMVENVHSVDKERMEMLVNFSSRAFGEKGHSSPLRIAVIQFLESLLRSYPALSFVSIIGDIVLLLKEASIDRYYKLLSACLVAVSRVSRVLQQLSNEYKDRQFFGEMVNTLYEVAWEKMHLTDVDQEVKDGAISAMGTVVSCLRDFLDGSRLDSVLSVMLEKLRNDITRLTATRVIKSLCEAIDLNTVFDPILQEVCSLLGKSNQVLVSAALDCLQVLATSRRNGLSVDHQRMILDSIQPLIEGACGKGRGNMHLVHYAFLVSATVVENASISSVELYEQLLLPGTVAVAHSGIVAGVSRSALLSVFVALVENAGMNTSHLVEMIAAPFYAQDSSSMSKLSLVTCAECIAAVVRKEKDRNCARTFENRFVNEMGDEARGILAMYVVGGLQVNPSSEIVAVVKECFRGSKEEAKTAASYALGCMVAADFEKYFHIIKYELENCMDDSADINFLLTAMREALSRADHIAVNQHQSGILEVVKKYSDPLNVVSLLRLYSCHSCSHKLLKNARSVGVSECLGTFGRICPKNAVEYILNTAENDCTSIAAVRHMVIEKNQVYDSLLKHDVLPSLVRFLDRKGTLHHRRALVLLANTCAHTKPLLLKESFHDLLPKLYDECERDETLVRSMKLGPVTHEMDEGLELRKSVFETLLTILGSPLQEWMNVSDFVSFVGKGLKDKNEDIRQLSMNTISRVAADNSRAILPSLSLLAEGLEKIVTAKVPEEAVEQERGRIRELINLGLQCIHRISTQVTGSDHNVNFHRLRERIEKSPELSKKYAEVSKHAEDE